MPEHFEPGHTLTRADVDLLREYIGRRDGRIRMLYDLRMEMGAKMRNLWLYAMRAASRRAVHRIKQSLGGVFRSR